MNTKILLLLTITFSLSIFSQETTKTVSMGTDYTDMIYYNLDTNIATNFTANNWDMAFLRTSAQSIDMRTNTQNGIEVFEASNDITQWNSIDITNETSWTQLYTDNTTWDAENGDISNGSASYGWGEYNPANHHVSGTVIFVLKYASGEYVKFINENFYGGYTFKYAKWNGSTWGTDITHTIANTSNPDNKYNYYSFLNENEVVASPATTDWDLLITKYYKYISAGDQHYPVIGVLHNEGTEVAVNIENTGDPLPSNLTYATEINTIGSDWKTFTGTTYTTDSSKKYYIKKTDGTIYRLYFTDFVGGSTGNITFNFENVTQALDLEDVTKEFSFGIYPNPTTNKEITLIYTTNSSTNNNVEIYNINGQKVFQQKLNDQSGFYNQTLNLNQLNNGLYILKVSSDNKTLTKKLVLK